MRRARLRNQTRRDGRCSRPRGSISRPRSRIYPSHSGFDSEPNYLERAVEISSQARSAPLIRARVMRLSTIGAASVHEHLYSRRLIEEALSALDIPLAILPAPADSSTMCCGIWQPPARGRHSQLS